MTLNGDPTRRTFLGALASALLLRRVPSMTPSGVPSVRALVFDVFGTVVDWRTTVIREGQPVGQSKGLTVDWARFADAWRGGYGPAMDRVRRGDLPWTNLDALHRMLLNQLLTEFRIAGLTEAEKDQMNHAWHRLDPWPDAVEGLAKLRRRFTVATLSNGNVALLTNLSKHAGLCWDCILSAELVKHYKPDREVYQMAADFLGLEAREVMMVAAHRGDLEAARAVGLKTAFVRRPLEYGPAGTPDQSMSGEFDLVAADFHDLASQLGA